MKGSITHLSRALVLWIAGACQAATLTVRPGDDLAATVRAAQPGDTVQVQRGQYRANLLIDKPLALRGLDRPTLSGGNQGHHPRDRAGR